MNKSQNSAKSNAEIRGKGKLLYPEISYKIRGACFELYKELGCGHKEVVYQRGLEIKLKEQGLSTTKEKQIPIRVSGKKVGAYVPDIVVEDKILVEIKAKKFITQQDRKQFWEYLTATDFRLGMLVNFGRPGGVQIIRRIYDTARRK